MEYVCINLVLRGKKEQNRNEVLHLKAFWRIENLGDDGYYCWYILCRGELKKKITKQYLKYIKYKTNLNSGGLILPNKNINTLFEKTVDFIASNIWWNYSLQYYGVRVLSDKYS